MTVATVREATAADAEIAASLQQSLWQQAYSELLPAAVLLADPAARAAAWAERIRSGGPVLLAYEGPEVVGLAAIGTEPSEVGTGELELLGVLPRWSRRGHGGRLIGSAAAALRAQGATRGQWWAPDTDRSIERFLAWVQWFPDGARRLLDTGEGTLTEIRYSGGLDLVLI